MARSEIQDDAVDDDAVGAGEKVYQTIRRQIQEAVFPPGERLREAELASALAVSRTPVRSALLRLGYDGLVEIIPNRGAFVTRWSHAEIEEIFDIRLALEPYSASLAVGQIQATDIDRLADLCGQMDRALDEGFHGGAYVNDATDLNADFHRIIIDATHDQQVRSLLTAVIEFPLMHRTVAAFPLQRLRHAWDEHREIVRALANNDAELAAATMTTHIMAARELLRHTPPSAPTSVRSNSAPGSSATSRIARR